MSETSGATVWEQMIRFQRLALVAMDETFRERFGRTLDDYDVLHQLRSANEPLRMSDLANRLLVANSSCNRIVGRLSDAGLVSRMTGEHDRREVLVDLTTEGRRLCRRMGAAHSRDIERVFTDRITGDDLTQLHRIFEQLADE